MIANLVVGTLAITVTVLLHTIGLIALSAAIVRVTEWSRPGDRLADRGSRAVLHPYDRGRGPGQSVSPPRHRADLRGRPLIDHDLLDRRLRRHHAAIRLAAALRVRGRQRSPAERAGATTCVPDYPEPTPPRSAPPATAALPPPALPPRGIPPEIPARSAPVARRSPRDTVATTSSRPTRAGPPALAAARAVPPFPAPAPWSAASRPGRSGACPFPSRRRGCWSPPASSPCAGGGAGRCLRLRPGRSCSATCASRSARRCRCARAGRCRPCPSR